MKFEQVLLLLTCVVAAAGGVKGASDTGGKIPGGSSIATDLSQRISHIESLFSIEGPTVNVLEEYERVLSEINFMTGDIDNVARLELPDGIKEQLPQLYFKKALIELNLNKESLAIADLKKTLELDPNKKPARSKLVDLLMENGDVETILPLLNQKEDSEFIAKLQKWINDYRRAEDYFNNHEYAKCLVELDEKVLHLAPSYGAAYELHSNALLKLVKGNMYGTVTGSVETAPINKLVIRDLHKLMKILPLLNLNWYPRFAQYLLFTDALFETGRQLVKSCLRINNEYKACGDVSKFYTKFLDLLKELEEYSIVMGHYYIEAEGANTVLSHDLEDPSIDFAGVHSTLFDQPLKVSKIEARKVPKDIKSNYDLLVFRARQFLIEEFGDDHQLNNLKFIVDLNRLACESLVRAKDKRWSEYCSRVEDSQLFLPKFTVQIDKHLKKERYEEAKQILDRFNSNVRQTRLFKERYARIEEAMHRRQQEQQQQFYQQQQQQQFHQQQQHRQQQQRAPLNPSNDYYKVLDISRDADEKTIKKAYRTQTLKFHPDKYKGSDMTPDQIEGKMQEINQAYEVLSDKQLRERYDRGDDPNDNGTTGQQQHQGNPNFMNFFNGGGFGFGNQGSGGHSFKFTHQHVKKKNRQW